MTGQMPDPFPVEKPVVPTLDELLSQWQQAMHIEMPGPVMDELKGRLYAREDNMADLFRLAGVQFGLFPEIVAEVLAEAGLGTPVDDDQRMMVRRNFAALMERLRNDPGTV